MRAQDIRRAWLDRTLYALSPVLLLASWELLSATGVIDARFFGRPSQIAVVFASMIASGELFDHLTASLFRVVAGFALGAIPGVLIGMLMGFSRTVRAFLLPIVSATFPIPKIALLPLLLIIFGIGETTAIMVVAIGVFFIVLYNTMDGVINLPQSYRDVSSSFGATRRQYIRIVALPGALPGIFTGLKVAVGIALLLIVAAEFVGTRTGIGYLVWSSWEVFAVEKMYVGIIVLAMLGFIASTVMDQLEARMLPWRP